MAYPHSINLIQIKLATKAHSYMHLNYMPSGHTRRPIQTNQCRLRLINLMNTAVIYIKHGSAAATVVKKGMHNCYTSILLICQNIDILSRFSNEEHTRILRTIIIVFFISIDTYYYVICYVFN